MFDESRKMSRQAQRIMALAKVTAGDANLNRPFEPPRDGRINVDPTRFSDKHRRAGTPFSRGPSRG